jgi:lipopolysaccharide assembly LptE-like protein
LRRDGTSSGCGARTGAARLLLSLCVCGALSLGACGYRVAGRASSLPPGLKVIAVEAFVNKTKQYRIEQRLTEAVVHEFLARTKYRIVSTENSADAVLHGEIVSLDLTPVVFDTSPAPGPTLNTPTNTARATTMLISVRLQVWLEDKETKKDLYRNMNFLFREPYEISTDVTSFFDEQGPALGRLGRDFAARLVADVLENF